MGEPALRALKGSIVRFAPFQLLAVLLIGALGACDCGGDDDGPPMADGGTDGFVPDSSPGARCGNMRVEVGEACDDGNESEEDACDNNCQLTCGNGVVNGGEQCDTAVASGAEGACPTACDDADACTTDTLVGGGTCEARCQQGPIAACANDDGCCPSGCDGLADNDCSASCGNGMIEPGETCDGNCPTECDDGSACTTDSLEGDAANCNAECVNTDVALCMDGDGCCPLGCDSSNDSECSASCGDGRVDPGETCDPP